MKLFKKGNWVKGGEVCPICKTQKTGQVILVSIIGTDEGYNVQAKQVHVECLDLWIDMRINLVYQLIE